MFLWRILRKMLRGIGSGMLEASQDSKTQLGIEPLHLSTNHRQQNGLKDSQDAHRSLRLQGSSGAPHWGVPCLSAFVSIAPATTDAAL